MFQVEKIINRPYPVEKIVHVDRPVIQEKIINRPYPVEKIVHVDRPVIQEKTVVKEVHTFYFNTTLKLTSFLSISNQRFPL